MQLAAVEPRLVTEAKMMADAEQTPGTMCKRSQLAKSSSLPMHEAFECNGCTGGYAAGKTGHRGEDEEGR